MDPNQPKEIRIKMTAGVKDKPTLPTNPRTYYLGRKKTSRKISGTSDSSQPPQPLKKPRTTSSSIPSQAPRLRNDLQRFRYDLFQGAKYSYGRQVEWNAYAHANFYTEVKQYIENMSWMDLVNFFEKCNSLVLVNEFYYGLLIHTEEYEILIRFCYDVLYTYFDG